MEDPKAGHHMDIHEGEMAPDKMVQSLGAPLYPLFRSLRQRLLGNLMALEFQDPYLSSTFYSLHASSS